MAAMVDDDIADCNGLSWSELATKLDLKSSDCEDVITMTTESPKTDTESMKLKKEEMMLYGLCPAQDEFFLVICEYCHLLIKPQALQYHMDVRHQDYSTSQFHNCALPNIDPIGPRNTKCSSHKTNSSVSAQSMNSTTGKSQTRPPRSKGRPSTKGANAAKNISEKTKPDVAVCESNVSVEKPRTGVVAATKKEPISLRVTPLAVKSENTVGNGSVPPEVILPPLMATAVKVEPKEPVVFEPTHLKISEEKEALVKLLESNEWRDFEIKLEKEDPDGVDVKSDFLIPDANHPLKCQKARTCGEGSSHSNEVATAVTSAASTFTPTTSTCSLSKSSNVVTMSGIATNASSGSASKGVALNARSSLSKASTETSCSVASSQPSTGRTLGDKTISLGKAIALVADVDETPGNSLLAKSDKKSNLSPVVVAQVKTDASNLSDHPSAVTHSVSNVNSKVQLKGSKGRKSPSKFLLCKDREFDANKHCGVWVEDIQKQCTRSLTCKSHSLSLRRAVLGRSKLFDQLLSEQRARKLTIKEKSTKFKLKDKGTAPSATEPSAPIVTSCTSASTSSAGGIGSLSTSSGPDVASIQPVDKPKKPVTVRQVKPLSADMRENSLVGPSVSAREEKLPDGVKEEGSREDGSNAESYRHCTMSHHPHPAAVNGFNSWVYGRGCYVFNRKEDLYRAAFLAAVEKHLHPPPHKKLCLESNLQTDVGMAKDPYDFLLLDGGHVAQSYGSLSSPTASSKPKPKHMSSSAQPTSERRPSASSSSVASSSSTNISTPKRPALDLLENKRKLAKTDVTSPDEALAKACALLPTDTIATVTANATSVHLVLPTRVEPMASLSNGQMLGIPIAEMVAAQRKSNTELRIVRPHPPHLNKMPVRTATTQPLAPSKAVPLAAKVAPGYGIAPNASIKLELRPALDGAKLPTESGIASLISNSGQRNLTPSECVTVCARAPSCGSTVGNSLLKPTTSLMTTNRIPNIVLTSTIPNGTMKLAQRNATINSTNQTSLAAILALNHATNARFTPRSESQAFITSTISSLGRTNQAAVVPSLDTQRQLNLSAHMSTTLQLQSAITGPMAPTRSGFSVASAGSTIANRQYIFASGVPHMYQAPVSATPKKPLAASRVQLLRPDLAPAGKTAASTTPLLAGSKCHLSGQPI